MGQHRYALVSGKLGAAAMVLVLGASPALASDFSGIGRAFFWLIFAVITLVSLLIVLWRGRGRSHSAVRNFGIALTSSILFAPAIVIQDFGGPGWAFNPLPGTLIAAIEGSFRIFFPGPALSIGIITGLLFMFLQWRSAEASIDAGEEEFE